MEVQMVRCSYLQVNALLYRLVLYFSLLVQFVGLYVLDHYDCRRECNIIPHGDYQVTILTRVCCFSLIFPTQDDPSRRLPVPRRADTVLFRGRASQSLSTLSIPANEIINMEHTDLCVCVRAARNIFLNADRSVPSCLMRSGKPAGGWMPFHSDTQSFGT